MLGKEADYMPGFDGTKDEQRLLQKTPIGFGEDPLFDDQALLVDSPEGIIVLLGCAHAGLINTLRYVVTDLTGKSNIHAILGGTHLQGVSKRRLDYTLDALQKFALKFIVPYHCTGFDAMLALHKVYGDALLAHQAGSVFEFG